MATPTYVFDPYCPRSIDAAPTVLTLLFEHDHIITSLPLTGEPLQPVIAAMLPRHRTLAAR